MNADIDIAGLAKLARLDVSEEEMKKLEREIPDILGFVATIQKAASDAPSHGAALRNVMRDDTGAHESGLYTKRLLDAAPQREGDRIAVKQVISRKKK